MYKVYDMPGVWGWVMTVSCLTCHISGALQTGEFRYLVFDAIYCQKGKEHLLADLFESACASEGYHTGLTWLDDRSELYDKLRTEVKMGTLNRMLNAKPGWFMQVCQSYREEKNRFYDAPRMFRGLTFHNVFVYPKKMDKFV